MVTFIKSVPQNFVYRKVIRNTWGSLAFVDGARFYNIFVIGKTDRATQALIDEEYDTHKDILQIDWPDSYS